MMPEEWPSMRSIARWVLPVLVGPSTAVTPEPGARSEGNVDVEEKAICQDISVVSREMSFAGSDRSRIRFISPRREIPNALARILQKMGTASQIGNTRKRKTVSQCDASPG